MRLGKVRHAVEPEVNIRLRARVHRGAEARLRVTAIDPARRQTELVGRFVIVEKALCGVQDLIFADATVTQLLDHILEVAR